MSAGRRALLAAGGLAAALLAGAAVAAGPLQVLDLRKCLRWEAGPALEPVRTAAFRAARLRARAPLQVFSASGDLPEGGTLRKFGACSLQDEGRKSRLRCAPGLDFPLAGASFVAADPQKYKSVIVLKCVAGCDQKIPEPVYLLRADFPDEELRDKEERARSAHFRRTCAGLR
jgi:hypothetical protein